jgi:predicted kinase
MPMKIPDFALVVLVGATGSGKSTFAARAFLATEIVSSDRCRALVSDDETDQTVTSEAFELVHAIAAKRLARRQLTVIDATSLRAEDRKSLIELARRHHALPVAIVFDLPEEMCLARNKARADRSIPARVVGDHVRLLRRSLRGLEREGFRGVHILRSEAEVAEAAVLRERSGAIAAASTGRSTSSATSMAAPTSSTRCSASSAMSRPAAMARVRIPREGERSSSAISSIAGRIRRACYAWSWTWSPLAAP